MSMSISSGPRDAGSSPPARNGASFAEVLPTPRGLRLVGVGAYSTVDSSASAGSPSPAPEGSPPSSRNFTFLELGTDPSPSPSAAVIRRESPRVCVAEDVPKMSSPARAKIPAPSFFSEPPFLASELDLRSALPLG